MGVEDLIEQRRSRAGKSDEKNRLPAVIRNRRGPRRHPLGGEGRVEILDEPGKAVLVDPLPQRASRGQIVGPGVGVVGSAVVSGPVVQRGQLVQGDIRADHVQAVEPQGFQAGQRVPVAAEPPFALRRHHVRLNIVGLEPERPFGHLQPLGQLAGSLEIHRQGDAGIRVVGIEREGAFERGAGLVRFAEFPENLAEVPDGLHVVGLEIEGEPESRHGLLAVSQTLQGLAAIAVSLGILGVEPRRQIVTGNRFVEASQLLKRVSQIVVGLRKRRVQLEGAPEAGLGVLGPAEREQHGAEAVVVGGVVALRRDRARDEIAGLLAVPLLVGDQSRQVQRVGVVGLFAKDFLVEGRRPVQLARPVEFQPLHQRGPQPRGGRARRSLVVPFLGSTLPTVHPREAFPLSDRIMPRTADRVRRRRAPPRPGP